MTNKEQMSALAYRLLRDQATILAQWRSRVEEQNFSSVLAQLSLAEFSNHIPDVLDRLSAVLRGDESASLKNFAAQHGAHRWQHGTSLSVVTQEWRFLHQVLMDHLAAAADEEPPIPPAALHQAYRLLSDEIHQAIAASLVEFDSYRRTEAEARMRDLEAVLEQREEQAKLLGKELHGVSHDLRGSFQLLKTACQLLKTRWLDSEAQQIVATIGVATDNLNQLLRDLLDLARLEAGREERHLRDFDAAALLQDLTASMRPAAEAEGLSLLADGPDSLPVCGDAVKIKRIAQNLILNALKYTPAGSVQVGWKPESEKRWLFEVRDSGPGLKSSTAEGLAHGLEEAEQDENLVDHEPLRDLPDQGERRRAGNATGSAPIEGHGEGIGLSVVHQLCELLDAVLEVESEPGRGAMFRVLLPTSYPDC